MHVTHYLRRIHDGNNVFPYDLAFHKNSNNKNIYLLFSIIKYRTRRALYYVTFIYFFGIGNTTDTHVTIEGHSPMSYYMHLSYRNLLVLDNNQTPT